MTNPDFTIVFEESGVSSLEKIIRSIIAKYSDKISPEELEVAINRYFTEHPVSGGVDTEEVNTIISDYLTNHPVSGGNRLKGKKILFLGDSITAQQNGWAKIIVELTGMIKIDNVSVASAVLADKEGTVYDGNPNYDEPTNNVLGNQVEKIINNNYEEEPDIIMISIGTNGGIAAGDNNIRTAYGLSLNEVDRTTHEGAFRYCNETLHNLYPNAVICWCNPIQGAFAMRGIYSNVLFGDALRKLTSYGACVNIETNRCGIMGANEKPNSEGDFLADGLHPNAKGALKIAQFNAAALNNLFV